MFQDTEKTKHRKNKLFLRSTTKNETEKTKFFDGKEKRERDFFAEA